MALIRRQDVTTSDGVTPEASVYVTVKLLGVIVPLYDDSGNAIANPVLVNGDGSFYYNVTVAGVYTEEYRKSLGAAPRTIITVTLAFSTDDAAMWAAQSMANAETYAQAAAASAALAASANAVAESVAANANATAQTAAAAAASTYSAIVAVLAGQTISTGFQYQPNSRGELALITGQVAGTTAYLNEGGRQGVFVWRVGNYSASVTADSRQGIYVASSANPTGSSGVWERQGIFGGIGFAQWFGIVADGATDDSLAINAALSQTLLTKIILPAGTLGVLHSVAIPTGKSLIGAGRDKTLIKLLAGFVRTPLPDTNAVVSSIQTAGVRLMDLEIDAGKQNNGGLASSRTHATMFDRCTDFVVERVDVRDATGYGHYHQGSGGTGSNGVWRDCTARNCNVNFEAMGLIGGLIDNCYADRGAADISHGTEALFHALNGSKNITYRDCRGSGSAQAMFNFTDVGTPMDDIRVVNCRGTVSGGSAIVAYGTITNLMFADCDLETTLVAQSVLNCDSGPTGMRFSNCILKGKQTAVYIQGPTGVTFDGCHIFATDERAGVDTTGIVSLETCYFNGGTISSIATAATGSVRNGPVVLSPDTVVTAGNWDVVTFVTDPTYTLAITDAWGALRVGASCTVTLPTHAAVAIPVGTEIVVLQETWETVITFAAAPGVTFYSKNNYNKIGGTGVQEAVARLTKVNTLTWIIEGDLIA
jgi:hypothetical protein